MEYVVVAVVVVLWAEKAKQDVIHCSGSCFRALPLRARPVLSRASSRFFYMRTGLRCKHRRSGAHGPRLLTPVTNKPYYTCETCVRNKTLCYKFIYYKMTCQTFCLFLVTFNARKRVLPLILYPNIVSLQRKHLSFSYLCTPQMSPDSCRWKNCLLFFLI